MPIAEDNSQFPLVGNTARKNNRRTLAYRKADATKSRTTSGKGTTGRLMLQFKKSPGGRERSGLRLPQGGRGAAGALRRLILWGSDRMRRKRESLLERKRETQLERNGKIPLERKVEYLWERNRNPFWNENGKPFGPKMRNLMGTKVRNPV